MFVSAVDVHLVEHREGRLETPAGPDVLNAFDNFPPIASRLLLPEGRGRSRFINLWMKKADK